MQKCILKSTFTIEKTLVLSILITSVLLVLFSSDISHATVESSIKGVGATLQKTSIGVAVSAFSLGGVGMMFGAQWGYRIAIGSIFGACFILGGPAIITFFQTQIR